MKKMKVVKLLDVQSGVSQQTGNPWKSREEWWNQWRMRFIPTGMWRGSSAMR